MGRTEGLGWEIAQIVRLGHLDKAIFVSPPLPGPELGERWSSVLEIMDDVGVPGALPDDASQTIATRFDPAGTATVFTGTAGATKLRIE